MKKRKRASILITIVLILSIAVPFLMLAFGNAATADAATIKINATKVTLTVGNTYSLKITGTTKSVKWTSSKTSVATVSASGKVTAKKKGTATITAAVNGKKYYCKVTVTTKYKDGVYEGSGTGYRNGTTTVSVTIENDVITDIEVISNRDTPRFFNFASSTVINEILDSQSAQVDAVSGATYSSNGIMEAVEDALSKALN